MLQLIIKADYLVKKEIQIILLGKIGIGDYVFGPFFYSCTALSFKEIGASPILLLISHSAHRYRRATVIVLFGTTFFLFW